MNDNEIGNNPAELNEQDLDKVAGGGATKNRYDEKVCPTMTRAERRCIGLGDLGYWCDHYRMEYVNPNLRTPSDWHWHTCVKGCFPRYYGKGDGTPIC